MLSKMRFQKNGKKLYSDTKNLRICKALLIFLVFLSAEVSANPSNKNYDWRWYRAAFGSPMLNTIVYTRNGTAKVEVEGNQINIYLYEENLPELQPKLHGSIHRNNLSVTLDNFSFHSESFKLTGKLKETKIDNCKFEEILLHRTEVNDGSIFVLSRVSGACK